MEDNDGSSSEDVHDDSGSSKKEKPLTKPSENFTKSKKVMVCHAYILSKCPHEDSESCKYTHPNIEVLQHILQSAMLNNDIKTATEIQRKINEITGKIVIGVLLKIQSFFGTLHCRRQ